MRGSAGIWHLVGRLDGYGRSRALRLVAARQARDAEVHVVPLEAERRIVDELRTAGVIVHVLGARWEFDPLAIARLAGLSRKRMAAGARVFAWDERADRYARLALRRRVQIHRVEPEAVVELRDFDAPHGENLRRLLDLEPATPIIATVGPLERRKHLDQAIWCYELVRVLHPAVRLVLFGNGADRERLERLALAISEPGCVRFVGYRNNLAALLAQVDMLWQLEPSVRTPCAVFEAMAARVPVVATDVPAHRTAIEPGASGLLTPLDSRIEVARATDDLFNDRALAVRLAEGARVRVERWQALERVIAGFSRTESPAER